MISRGLEDKMKENKEYKMQLRFNLINTIITKLDGKINRYTGDDT